MSKIQALSLGAVALCALAGCSDASTPVVEEDEPLVAGTGKKPRQTAPDGVVGGFAIQLPERTLEPGEERFPCWVFPLEVEGPSLLVGGGKLTVDVGLHHGNVTTRPKTGEGIRPCGGGETGAIGGEATDILKGGAVLFGSSTQFVGEEWQSFPEGMAYPIRDGFEIVARMHYLNATSEPITVAPTYEWYTVDEATVTQTLGPFAWVLSGWEIPPLSDYTATANCKLPGDMNLVNVLPHMHALGTAFTGGYVGGPLDGQLFLDSKGYDPEGGVLTQYEPAVELLSGNTVSFACSWQNHFDKPIVEGVGDNEMCIIFGYGYPYERAYSATASLTGCAMVAPPEL